MKFNRKHFLETLRDLVEREVPFLHQGKDPAIGLDCISAPRYAVEVQGVELPEEVMACPEAAVRVGAMLNRLMTRDQIEEAFGCDELISWEAR